MEGLFRAAREVRECAYAPYSGYKVGAAVLAADGSVYAGCNVENVAYGSTICAERSAILAMVAAGQTTIKEILVLTSDRARPCGACLQVISEFSGPSTLIHCCSDSGDAQTYTLGELLPQAFSSRNVNRTEP